MSISANTLIQRLAREFGVSAESERFSTCAKDAINDSLWWLNEVTSLDLSEIPNTSSSIACDAVYARCIIAGARRSLALMGEWGKKPEGDLMALHKMELARAQTQYQEDNPPSVGPYTEAASTDEG